MQTRRSFIKGSAVGAALLAIVLLVACGASSFATEFRLVVAAGAPFLSVAVQQGKISPALRDGLIADLTNEVTPISAMAGCFDAIAKGDPDSKLKHLQCVQALERAPETKKLLTDFGSHPAVQNIAEDFDAILQGALIFYGSMSKNASIRAGGAVPTVTEADLKERITKLKHDLGQ